MPNKRPIPKVDTKSTATAGAVVIKPWSDGKSVCVEIHHCTIFLEEEEKEALSVILSLMQSCITVWGQQFARKFLTYVEKL